MEQLKFGIIGAGILAPLHAKAITSNPKGKLVAVSDLDYQKAEKLAYDYNIDHVFTDYKEMLQEVDIVCICIPSGLHANVIVECAARRKHILCEKPLDVTFEHMDRIIQVCRKYQVKLGSVFQRRTLPHIIAAKNAVENGDIGKMVMIHANLKYYRDDAYYQSAGWRGTWKLDGGGALMNQGVHGIDLMQWISGEVESVFAYSDTLTRKNIEVEDTAAGIIKFKNGGFGTIQGATSVFPEQETSIEVNGDQGTIKISDTRVDKWEIMDNEMNPPGKPFTSDSDHNGHAIIIDDMIDAVLEDRSPMISGIEARKSVEIILALYESARLRKEIRLADFHPYQEIE